MLVKPEPFFSQENQFEDLTIIRFMCTACQSLYPLIGQSTQAVHKVEEAVKIQLAIP